MSYQRSKQIIEGFRRDAIAQQEHNARMRANAFWAAIDSLRYVRAGSYTELNECELEQRVKLARETAV